MKYRKWIEFSVLGTARPRGSKRALVNPRTGRAQMVDSSKKSGPWMNDIATALHAKGVAEGLLPENIAKGFEPWSGPVLISVEFGFKRPQSHQPTQKDRRAGWDISPQALPVPKGADIDKLQRALLDALTGIAYVDDKQVADVVPRKRWKSVDMMTVAIYYGPRTEAELREWLTAAR